MYFLHNPRKTIISKTVKQNQYEREKLSELTFKGKNPENKGETDKIKFGCEMKIYGRVCQAPELRYTPTGKCYSRFSVSFGGYYDKEQNKQIRKGVWWNCQSWGSLGETINQVVNKGDVIEVVGVMHQSSYQGKNYQYTTVHQLTTADGCVYEAEELKE